MYSFAEWLYRKMSKRIKLDNDSEPGPSTSGVKNGSESVESEETNKSFGFEGMPVEMIWRIFKEMNIVDVVKLKGENRLLNEAVRLYMRNSMVDLRKTGTDVLTWLQTKLETAHESNDYRRLDIVKGIYFVRYVLTEIELLFATVWRFSDDDRSWDELVVHLAPVLAEFEQAIRSQGSLETTRFDLYPHRIREVFQQWNNFLLSMDNGFEQRLQNLRQQRTPFEIKVIDLLMCAPGLNFQLALKRWVAKESKYDVYGYFKTSTLKPVGQVPGVFNTVLNIEQKKRLLITYLRDTCHQDNMNYLLQYTEAIRDLERAIIFSFYSEEDQVQLVSSLDLRYRNAQGSPFNEVAQSIRLTESKNRQFEEYYVRCVNENLTFTNLQCIALVPQQNRRNLPLALPYLRGRRRQMDHLVTRVERDSKFEWSRCDPWLNCQDDPERARIIGSDAKPRFQLIIHYRESFYSGPSEIVINIGYDDTDTCHLTFHNLTGEPLA